MKALAIFMLRPVGTTLSSLALVLGGVLAYWQLPVAPLPDYAFPMISVSANLPGASAQTMASSVAMPLEQTLGRIAGVTEMYSHSAEGSTQISLLFELSRDVNGAARDVQAAINAARPILPSSMPGSPIYRKVNPAAAPIMILALSSATVDKGALYDLASTVIAQKLQQVPGVGEVSLGGSALPAVRVTLNPRALAAAGIALDEVRQALSSANSTRPNGILENDDQHWLLDAGGQLSRAAQYQPLIVAWRNSAPVRLRDVAVVEDSVENRLNTGFFNDEPAVLLLVRRQPSANILDTVNAIHGLIPQLQDMLPAQARLTVAQDRTPSIRATLYEAEKTLIIAVLLVLGVVLLFLRNVRAALIPGVVVPVSLIATFMVMWWAGYSLNTVSLMALIVATGFVVDDAIVVLENIMRWRAQGLSMLRAAMRGMRDVAFTVTAMSLSLVAVFAPLLVTDNLQSRLFREFALTLSAAVLISLLLSLTLTPMMCAQWLRPVRAAPKRTNICANSGGRACASRQPSQEQGDRRAWHSRLARAVAAVLTRTGTALQGGYQRSLAWALHHGRLMLLVLAGAIGLNVYLYVAIPKTMLPQQDTGQILGFFRVDQATSFAVMQPKLDLFRRILLNDPAIASVAGFASGRGGSNSTTLVIQLTPLAERRVSANTVINRLRRQLQGEPGARLTLVPQQDIFVGGLRGSAAYSYGLLASDVEDLRTWLPRIQQALAGLPELVDVDPDVEDRGRRIRLRIDRDAATRLGVDMSAIASTLNSAFSDRQVSVIYQSLNQYRVVMAVDAQYARDLESLQQVQFITPAGRVPLAAFAAFEETSAPASVRHTGLFVSESISFNLAPGVELDQAARAIEQAVALTGLPTDRIQAGFQGEAQGMRAATAQQPLLILAALVAVYVVLGMLYESTVHPWTILSTLPSAGLGALIALMLAGEAFSLIAVIGIFLLIGIVKKNAILMVDFALQAQRRQRLTPHDAILQACVVRFRPIMMTTLCAMLGALPLVLATGEGVEMRRPLGVTIIGGLALSQLLTLYTTPVVYLYLDRARLWAARKRGTTAEATTTTTTTTTTTALSLTLTLTACAVGPDYTVPTQDMGAQYRAALGWIQTDAVHVNTTDTTNADTADTSNVATPMLRADWWTLYDDDALNTMMQRLQQNNLTIRQAEARYRQAQASLQATQSDALPGITANSGVTRSGSGASVAATQYSVSTTVAWEADVWGRIRRSVEAGEASLQASAADLAATRLSMQSTLAQTWFRLRALDIERDLYAQTLQAYERSLRTTQNRYDAGVSAPSEVAAARSQLENARVQNLALLRQRAAYEHAIAVLLGQPPSALALDVQDALPAVAAIPVGLPSELLLRRPDVLAAERRMAQANARIGVAQAAWFPSLTLSAQGGYRSGAWSQWLSAPAQFWSLGPALALTLFDGGARQGRIAEARAEHDLQTAAWQQTALTALQEVEDGLVQLRGLGEEQQVQARALDAARESLRLTTNQYEAGLIDYLSVVQVEATALNAERAAINLRMERLVSSVRLIAALGGGWEGQVRRAAPEKTGAAMPRKVLPARRR